MKKLVFSLLLLLLFSSCSSPSADPSLVGAYDAFESASDGIRFQYPVSWVNFSTEEIDLSDAGIIEELASYGISRETAESFAGQNAQVFYNPEMTRDGFTPNLNYIVSYASGLTQEALKTDEALGDIRQSVEDVYLAAFEDFSWLSEPIAKTLGSNVYACLTVNYAADDISVSSYQAVTISGEKVYTFTYTTVRNTLSNDMIAKVEAILSSVTFF